MRCPNLEELPDPPFGKTGWPWTEASAPLPETLPKGEPWPKISIVTPSYNQGQFIEETIRSVLLQGYPNLEYIVIDGGSTDDSVEIIRKYERWIDYWISEPDRGQSHAINKGLRQCSGSIFNWINSDDLLTKGALQVIGKEFGESDVLVGRGWISDGRVDRLHSTTEFSFINLVKGSEGCIFQQQCVWLLTDKVRICGMIDEEFEYAMDRELYVRYTYRFTKVTYVDKPLAKFRLHSSSKTSRNRGYFYEDHVRMARKMLRSGMEHPDLDSACKRYVDGGEWKIYVDRMKRRDDGIRVIRVIKIVLAMMIKPGSRINRYSLGAIKQIILN